MLEWGPDIFRALNLVEGLQYLHGQKVVHRDLALRNLLVSKSDRELVVKISDFGMSRVLEETDYYKVTGNTIPVRWSAPEVLQFQRFSFQVTSASESDLQSDIWSFGVTL